MINKKELAMIILRKRKLRIAALECKIRISSYLMNGDVVSFKIGKTAGSIENRYGASDEYKKGYDRIISIFETKDKALVDDLERTLIRDYMMTYPTKCANEQIGSGPNCADSESETACIYIVVKNNDEDS